MAHPRERLYIFPRIEKILRDFLRKRLCCSRLLCHEKSHSIFCKGNVDFKPAKCLYARDTNLYPPYIPFHSVENAETLTSIKI